MDGTCPKCRGWVQPRRYTPKNSPRQPAGLRTHSEHAVAFRDWHIGEI
jgi:hypothetical protein